MNKKLISLLLTSAMSASVCVSAMAASDIKFADKNGDAISSVPELGSVKVSAENAGKVLIAEYNKDGRLLRVNENSMENINEFDGSTYVKAFALDSYENITPTTEYATIDKAEDKALLISYAEKVSANTGANPANLDNTDTAYTYGSAAHSMKRTNNTRLPESIQNGLDVSKYDTVKVRYYAGSLDQDRFAFCLCSADQFGGYTKLENRYLYAPVKPNKVGWNVATIKIAAMLKCNTTDNPNTEVDESVRMPLSEAKYWALMTHDGKKVYNVSQNHDKPANNNLYIDSIWFEDNSNVIDFSLDDTWTVIGKADQFTKDTNIGYGDKTQSAKVSAKTENNTGYFDLAAIGFKTDWSGYKTINIRYKTSNVGYVPPVRLSTIQNWVNSSNEDTENAYKPTKANYASKKAAKANEWTVVSYSLENDFAKRSSKNDNISWSNLKYMQIPTNYLHNYWANNSGIEYKAWNGTDNIYIDSIWLSK